MASGVRQPRTSMDSATRSSWLSPALENAVMLGSSPAGTLSMQKKPISSSAFIAPDFPAPESPLTIKSSMFRFPVSFSLHHADLFFEVVACLFLYNGTHLIAQCQHIRAGRTAQIHHKAAVLVADCRDGIPAGRTGQ